MYDINKVAVNAQCMDRIQELFSSLKLFTGIKNGKESQNSALIRMGVGYVFYYTAEPV
jgi:hypothetical protein